ncbi:MAG: hypothetical protein B6D41_21595 [Chloroflexi bacterium UTCFX4]|jgi:hypothetical protein|nr:MAG: hypothetical protein B6D41_21595 [Chloroflexi bacterium UTCFX4]
MFRKKFFIIGALALTCALVLSQGTARIASADACNSVFRQTSWNSAATWTCGHVPTSADAVTIQPNHPIFLDTTGFANSLTIDGNLTVQNDNALFVQGDFTNNGTFDAGAGRVVKTGTGAVSNTSAFNDFYVNDGLVGYWKLDEGGTYNAEDFSGYGNTATLTQNLAMTNNHAPTLFSNPNAYQADDSAWAHISDSALLRPTSFTISGWFNKAAGGMFIQQLVGKAIGSGTRDSYAVWLQTNDDWTPDDNNTLNTLICTASDCAHIPYTFSLSHDAWYHYAVTFDDAADTLKLFLNGAEVGSTTTTIQPEYDSHSVMLGAGTENEDTTFRVWGKIDDVRLYNRALTASEITALAAGNHPNTSIATTTLNSALDVNGKLVLNSGTLNVATNNVTVAGDLQRNGGVFTPNSQTVTFDGATSQTIDSDSLAFHNLAVSSGTTLIETELVALSLTGNLTNGGTLRKARTLVATGNVSFGLTGVNMNITTRGTLSNLQVDRIDANAPNQLPGFSSDKYWNITPTGSGYTVNLTLPHNNLSDPKVCRYTSGTNWACARTSFTSSAVTRNGVNNFSTWQVLNQAPTSATLTQFQAARTRKNFVKLKWETGSELAVVGFNVWRKQGKGAWKQLNAELMAAKNAGQVTGASYTFSDKDVKQGKKYRYKVQVVKGNGTSEWSGAILVK